MSDLRTAKLTLVESLDDLDEFRRWLGERRAVMAVDTETSGLHITDKIRLVQFGDTQQGWVLPYRDWRGAVRDVLATYEEPIVLHHAKFDARMFLTDGLPFPWERAHDTLLMCHMHNSAGPKALKTAAARYVDEESAQTGGDLRRAMTTNRWTWATVPENFPLYWGYAALDVVLTARLAEYLWPKIKPYRAAYDLERSCQRVLAGVEMRGVRIDVNYCEETLVELQAERNEILRRMGDVSPNAPSKIAAALQEQGAVLTRRTPNGQLAMDKTVLEPLAEEYPLAADVLRAKYLGKMASTYFENFLKLRHGDLLHPHINQVAARTGRMSVTDPALQTIPRTAQMRDPFVPREGRQLVLVDYDNQELRVAAHFSGDESLLQAFADERDLHGETARRIFGDDYTRENRQVSKNGLYSWTYGAGLETFASTVGMPLVEADHLKKMLGHTYPRLAHTMAETTSKVRERADGGSHGFIQLLDGRHLRVPADTPYMGFNYLIQGNCAVVLKQALVDLDHAGLGEYIVLPVHDEAIFDVPTESVREVSQEAMRIMTRSDFRAPLTVGASAVDRWGDKYR